MSADERDLKLVILAVTTLLVAAVVFWMATHGGFTEQGRIKHDLEDSGFSCEQRDRTPGGWDLNCHR